MSQAGSPAHSIPGACSGWASENSSAARPADSRSCIRPEVPAEGVIAAVEDWNSGTLDDGLFAAINESWETSQFSGVIRDAFIYLESVIRELGQVDSARGSSGERLVTATLDPNSHYSH
jgi:hypothetical protein